MKTIQCLVSTGDKITDGIRTGKIGQLLKGKIAVQFKVSEFSGITVQHSTRELNKLIREGKYTKIN